MQSGCQGFYGMGGRMQDIFAGFMSFLDAAAESYMYAENAYSNDSDSNMSMFPQNVVEWAAENADEIGILRIEIEETDEVLIES